MTPGPLATMLGLVAAGMALSAPADAAAPDLVSANWIRVEENHAVLSSEGRDYLFDSYIVPFEQPYYIHVRARDGGALERAQAERLAEDYIRPRGCTQPLQRRPDLDAGDPAEGVLVLGIQC
ncbi:hypothetical protein [Stenotrophomonas mori]|uniref:Uncharacterized protein n=1 Tax=Stenotrophomonas mori TaxID=2871096 RepID=A0ABT0SHL5_9GAMM|nr:hypothetical protein [Stenotrophomonas mori]MCL7714826.1 hypothetical protein [Stenotrophomonas mori]